MTQPATFLITQIIRGSYVDGPGLRSVFFCKGCPLHCGWCHNPETQRKEPEILYDSRRCIRCLSCVEACPHDAIDTEKEYIINSEKCTICFACIDACPTLALRTAGKKMTVSEIMEEIIKDKIFYDNSGGGVTFSGGEPLLYHKPLGELLPLCRQNGIHTSIDTSLAVPWEYIDSIREYTDLFLVDIKHTTHKEVCPDLVFANVTKLAETARIWIRIPVIPDFNDTEPEMASIAEKLSLLQGKIEKVCLLPFHNTAEMKYRYLNRNWNEYKNKKEVPEARIAAFKEIFEREHFTVKIGG